MFVTCLVTLGLTVTAQDDEQPGNNVANKIALSCQ